jgi:hypothetical protein
VLHQQPEGQLQMQQIIIIIMQLITVLENSERAIDRQALKRRQNIIKYKKSH